MLIMVSINLRYEPPNRSNLLYGEVGDFLQLRDVERDRAGFLMAMFLDKFRKRFLSSTNNNHITAFLDKTCCKCFADTACSSDHKDFLVLKRHGDERSACVDHRIIKVRLVRLNLANTLI